MQTSIVMLYFFSLDQKHPFWTIFTPKNQNGYFKLKFFIWPNLNKQNSIAMLTFHF